jgi:hypothetical protein
LNRNFSKVGWGHPLEAQNVLAVRLKLIQPIFLFELSEGSSLRVLEVLVSERTQLALGREFRRQCLISFSYPSASRLSGAVNAYRLLALTDRENQRLLKAVPCANGVQWFRLGIESGGFKQCDTFFKNLLPAQICASSGPIDGSVELNLDYFAFLAESKVCLREKLSDGLRRFSLGFSLVVYGKGRRGQNAPG